MNKKAQRVVSVYHTLYHLHTLTLIGITDIITLRERIKNHSPETHQQLRITQYSLHNSALAHTHFVL